MQVADRINCKYSYNTLFSLRFGLHFLILINIIHFAKLQILIQNLSICFSN